MFDKLRILVIATTISSSMIFPLVAQAESNGAQSAEEMAERFKKQKTRGLVISTPQTVGVKPEVSNTQVKTTETPAGLPEIPDDERVAINISFDFDSAALRSDQRPKLETLCSALKQADVQQVRILGHTDSSGAAAYNLQLSKLRAEEVKRFLVSDCGYPEDRLQAIGVGEEQLFDPNNPRGDVNRRVEFQALS